ncbi:YrhA family protein [Pseudomonas sp. NPDC089396]|uniref:YrhA family protein n=1 Tax=Pseudomonas sp. NPDC089396 TaxID=3364461 RepID=UPI0038390595
MDEAIRAEIINLREALDDGEMYVGPPATMADIASLTSAVWVEMAAKLPVEYLDFLENFDGLVACGVFIYSSHTRVRANGKLARYDFMRMNRLGRELGFMDNFLVFGDSDLDEYVLDLSRGKYQVRDRQAFDNVFEEFETFDGLLGHMVDLIVHWSKNQS